MSDPDWVETWTEHASAFDRVRSTVMTVDEPRTAAWIADRAEVAESTARDHLSRLVEMDVLSTVELETGLAYEPDPAYVRFREIKRLVTDHDRETLGEFAVEVKDGIETLRAEYDAESPAELRERATAAETSPAASRELLRAASDWDHYRYRRSLLEEAVSRYDEYRFGRRAPA